MGAYQNHELGLQLRAHFVAILPAWLFNEVLRVSTLLSIGLIMWGLNAVLTKARLK